MTDRLSLGASDPGPDAPVDTRLPLNDAAARGDDAQAARLQVDAPAGTWIAADPATHLATLTYVVTNTGSLPVDGVVVRLTQYSDATLTVVSATSTQGTIDATTTSDPNSDYPAFASLGSLAPGASATITLTVRTGAAGSGYLSGLAAEATSPQLDDGPADTGLNIFVTRPVDPTPVAPTPPPSPTARLQVGAPAGTWIAADPATHLATLTYVVTNTGSLPVDGVVVRLTQYSDATLTVVSATSTQGTIDATTTSGPNSDYPAFASLGTLAPGASATVTLTVRTGAAGSGFLSGLEADAYSPQLDYKPSDTGINIFVTRPADPAPVAPDPPASVTAPEATSWSGSTLTPISLTAPSSDPIAAAPAPAGPMTAIAMPISPPAALAPADVSVAAAMPVVPRVGSAGLLMYTVRNVGAGAAGDVVVRLDLGRLPAGSFYAIESLGSTGVAGALTPVAGEFGVYDVDLGPMAADASASVAVLVNPAAGGAMGVVVAASDARPSAPDPNTGDNLAYAGGMIAPRTIAAAGAHAGRGPGGAATRASVAIGTGAGNRPTTIPAANTTATVRLAATGSRAATHRVTVRAVHPAPAAGLVRRPHRRNP